MLAQQTQGAMLRRPAGNASNVKARSFTKCDRSKKVLNGIFYQFMVNGSMIFVK